MSIQNVLRGEHEEVKLLMKSLNVAPEKLDNARLILWKKIKNELLSHAEAEQESVYPALAEITQNQDIVEEAQRDHEQIKSLIMEMDVIDETSKIWTDNYQALEEKVNRHINEEETDMFEKMNISFTAEESKQLANDFHTIKKEKLDELQKMDKLEVCEE